MIKSISIKGFRGFGIEKKINFSLPNGNSGSGLTTLVGANNCGKTTIIEAIRCFNGFPSPSFSVGRRNLQAKDRIKIVLTEDDDNTLTIETIDVGGSLTKKECGNVNGQLARNYYVLQSRRFVEYEFGKIEESRDTYITNRNVIEDKRSSSLSVFQARLFEIQKNKAEFDALLGKILGKDINWMIDQNDNGSYFVKFNFNGKTHTSEGLGDGIWSIFTICDALYDSTPKSTIVIDEPELSLHPAYQKKLSDVIMEYSKDRQIIICTHSPYFIKWEAIVNGANLIRTVKDEDGNINTFGISEESRKKIKGLLRDMNNPHVLGINANEIFFLEDKIILVEGQEDIVIFKKISEKLNETFDGEFFGWGVGGAPKMNIFLQLFKDLGYKKVVAIFDGDKSDEMELSKVQFPEYKFIKLPTDDIRDKEERSIRGKSGITNQNGNLKDEYEVTARKLITESNQFFQNKN